MKTNKTNNKTSNKTSNKALDTIELQVAKAEKQAKIEENKKLRLFKASNRFDALKFCKETKGFANTTLSILHSKNALNASVQGSIDALNAFIKDVASVNNLDKKIVASLKGEAAKTILQQVTNETLPLYIDNKGNYKVETLYRLIASKAKMQSFAQS